MGDQTQTDAENATEALEVIDMLRGKIDYLQNNPVVAGYAAEEELDEALNHIEAARADVNRHGEEEA